MKMSLPQLFHILPRVLKKELQLHALIQNWNLKDTVLTMQTILLIATKIMLAVNIHAEFMTHLM